MQIATVFSFLGILGPFAFAAPSPKQQKVFSDKLIDASSSLIDCHHEELFNIDAGIIPDGDYSITSPSLVPGFGIGRWVEDLSLAPKKIMAEPYGQTGNPNAAYV